MTPHCARRNTSWRALRPPSMRILQCSVATSALFPALPLPSIVKLNTGLKLAEPFHFTQTEMEKSVLKRVIVNWRRNRLEIILPCSTRVGERITFAALEKADLHFHRSGERAFWER